MRDLKVLRNLGAALVLLVSLDAASAAAPAKNQDVEPEALAALDRMGAYLRTLQSFEIKAVTTTDVVLDDGQKVQFAGTNTYKVRRPNGFVISVANDRKVRQFYYDGKSLTRVLAAHGLLRHRRRGADDPRDPGRRLQEIRHRAAAGGPVPLGLVRRPPRRPHQRLRGRLLRTSTASTRTTTPFREGGVDWQTLDPARRQAGAADGPSSPPTTIRPSPNTPPC
ncbi:MAG: DUF2092 domain-containing protein [Rhizomicrobium sp.]